MADRLTQKISRIKGLLKQVDSGGKLSKDVLDKEICSLWEWILFFQHERLIHLLVTLLFASLTFLSFSVFLITNYLPVAVIFGIFLIMLVPYVFHYYHLENGVQKLYDLYDQLKACREDCHE
ncbi:MAG: hypothetical protein WCG21_09895 [Eubacteriales bacterium]